MTLYETLGLPRDADVGAIKAAYRRAARKHHPDAGGDPSEFAKVQQAYDTLMDPEKRSRYDATGQVDDQAADHAESRAREKFANDLLEAVQNNDSFLFHRDLLASLRATGTSERAKVKKAIATLEGKKALAAKLAARIKPKGPTTPNIPQLILDSVCRDIDKTIAQANSHVAVLDAYLAILDAYEFEKDADPLASQEARYNDDIRYLRFTLS